MKGKGDNLEIQVKDFFGRLFEECGYKVLKNRRQKSGTQDGFDNEIIISKEFDRFRIYIECKDYTTTLNYSDAIVKIPQIVTSYKPDLFLFISPKKKFSNSFNDTRLEDYYNTIPTPIEFLTPDNKVEELFAIEPLIYKKVYGKLPNFKIDKQKKIEWLKEFLFSSRPLKKIILDEDKKFQYITNIARIDNYIKRSYTLPNLDEKSRSFYTEIYAGTLNDSLNNLLISNEDNNSGLVVLGNPGIGKSIDLKNLAINLWENRVTEEWIPYFREVKTFVSANKIEDYLPENWGEIPKLVIILDGLDEVSESQEFCSKLEKFVVDNLNRRNSIKFILSCRTNIYDNVIKDITGFTPLFIDKIYFSDAIKFLENYYGLLQNDSYKLSFNKNQQEFLENPYYLNLFGEYYQKERKLPTSKSDLIKKYVEQRLKDDSTKFKKKGYDKSSVISACKKTALAMEAMQINEIEETELNLLLDKKNNFIDSSFSEKVFEKDSWKFEHRNLQEYFVAKSLKNLSFEEIIEFITIDDCNLKTHPSWLNSISYLISIINKSSSIYLEIIDWLVKNDPQVLFKSDSDRISEEIKFKVFKEYFENRCKKQTLWIRTYDADILELAKFADSKLSIDYLLKEISNEKNHRRTRISAFDLLTCMDLSERRKEIEKLSIKLLKAPKENVDYRFKANILHSLKKLKFHKQSDFINKIINALGDIDFHQITSALLFLIEEDNPDKYFTYIKNHTPKVFDESKRIHKKKDNLSTSEDLSLIRILNNFNKKESLIFALKVHLGIERIHYGYRDTENDISIIITKLIKLFPKDNSVYNDMIKLIDNNLYESAHGVRYKPLIYSFFEKTNTLKSAFKDLYTAGINTNIKRHFLVIFANKENIEILINDFNEDKVDKDEIIYFKNSLSHHNFKLAVYFEKLVERKTSISFKRKLNVKKREKWSKFNVQKHQKAFDILFKKEKLIEVGEKYFSLHSKGIITWKNNKENKKEYRKSIELQSLYPQTFIDIIHDALRYNEGKIVIEDFIKLIRDELYLIYKIKVEITSTHQNGFSIKSSQIRYVKKWCEENIPLADFKNYRTNSIKGNVLRCELLWYFRNYFKLNYSKETLLNMLFIDGQIDNKGNFLGYNYILNNVEKSSVNERVIQNLRNEKLEGIILDNHITYAIENNLNEVFFVVEDYLESIVERTHNQNRILKQYFDKTGSISFLKKLFNPHETEKNKDGLTWDSIELLLMNGENKYVIEKLLDFRKKNKNDDSQLTIIKYLIRANSNIGFKLFNKWLVSTKKSGKQIRSIIQSEDYLLHTNKDSIEDLITLFKIGHNDLLVFDEMFHPNRISTQTLENICKYSNSTVCEKVIGLLKKVKIDFEKKEKDLFYINSLIGDINNHYYNHKSKPVSFSEISKKLDELKYKVI